MQCFVHTFYLSQFCLLCPPSSPVAHLIFPPSLSLSFYLSIYISLYLSIYLSISLSIYLSIQPVNYPTSPFSPVLCVLSQRDLPAIAAECWVDPHREHP